MADPSLPRVPAPPTTGAKKSPSGAGPSPRPPSASAAPADAAATTDPLIAHQPAPGSDAPARPHDEVIAEPVAPRLPMPGMLKDGLGPRTTDFRGTLRAGGSSSNATAIGSLPGVMPPSDHAHPPRKTPPKAGETAAMVAQAAIELMQPNVAPSTSPPVAAEPQVAAASPHLPSASPTQRRTGRWRGGLAITGGLLAVGLLIRPMLCTPSTVPEPILDDRTIAAAVPSHRPSPVVESSDRSAAYAVAGPPVAEPTVASDSTGAVEPAPDPTDDPTTERGAPLDLDDPGSLGPSKSEPLPGPEPSTPRKKARSRPPRRPAPSGPTKNSTSPTRTPASPNPDTPATLLADARSAYRSGNGARAYRLASRSNKLHTDPRAAELMVLASCQQNNVGRAKTDLKRVPLLRRPSVRNTCKSKHGVRLGL